MLQHIILILFLITLPSKLRQVYPLSLSLPFCQPKGPILPKGYQKACKNDPMSCHTVAHGNKALSLLLLAFLPSKRACSSLGYIGRATANRINPISCSMNLGKYRHCHCHWCFCQPKGLRYHRQH
jgi:hypothetical protein